MPDALVLTEESCARLKGMSVRDCACKLPSAVYSDGDWYGGGWLECPPSARGILVPVEEVIPPPPRPRSMAGEFCQTCGSPNMIRTGTCMTCASCGDSSGGCS